MVDTSFTPYGISPSLCELTEAQKVLIIKTLETRLK